MEVADADYQFVYTDIGGYGKDCNSMLFKATVLWKEIGNETIDPSVKNLSGTTRLFTYFLISNAAFALHHHLLRIYGGYNLSIKKRVFNYHLSQARWYVECTFGILNHKWQIFQRPINFEPDLAIVITRACVFLHNYVLASDGYRFEDTLLVIGLEDSSVEGEGMIFGGAIGVLDKLADYFVRRRGNFELANI